MFSNLRDCTACAVFKGLGIALALVLAGCFDDKGGDGPDPDLVISGLTVGNVIGVPIPFSIAYANTGGRNATGFQIRLYLSEDQILSEDEDTPWRTVISPSEAGRVAVGPGETKIHETSIAYPREWAPGSWYVIAKIDSENAVAESNEGNNIFVSDLLQLRQAAPDLTISGLTLTPANAGATTWPFTATVDIENRGEIDHPALQVTLYLSDDREWSSSDDLSIGTLSESRYLQAGYTGQAVVSAAVPDSVQYYGPRYVIAVIDKDNAVDEIDETNNVYVLATTINVRDGVAPLVTDKTPAPDSLNLPYDTTVTATFNEPMDAASIQGGTTTTAGTAQIRLGNNIWNTSVSYDEWSRTATITPNKPLIGGFTYRALFTNGITDAAGNALSPVYWDFTTKTHFSTNGQSVNSHMGGHAILLDSGEVLVFGGMDATMVASQAMDTPTIGDGNVTEIYNPNTKIFTAVDPMNYPKHRYAAATKMPSGNVLVTGGYFFDTNIGAPYHWWATEVYDVATRLWSFGPDLKFTRVRHQVVALGSGDAFVSGGISLDGSTSPPTRQMWRDTEIITEDPAVPSVPGPLLNVPRFGHTATLLSGDKVLIAGGFGLNGYALASVEIYDPNGGGPGAATITELANPMTTARGDAQAVPLGNDKVLLIGGATKVGTDGVTLKTAEIFDLTTGSFEAIIDEMGFARKSFRAVKLTDGKVLIVGGERVTEGQFIANGTAEVFDPNTKTFSSHDAVDPASPQALAPSVALADGNAVVFSGGAYGTSSTDPTVRILRSNTTSRAYIYRPDPPPAP